MEITPNGKIPQSEEKNRRALQLTPEELLKKFSIYMLSGLNVNDFEESLNVLKRYDYHYTLEHYFDYILEDLRNNETTIDMLSQKNGIDIINKTYWFIIRMFSDEMDKMTREAGCCTNDDIIVDGVGVFSYICFDRTPSVDLQTLIYRIPLNEKKKMSILCKTVIEEDLKLKLYTTTEERGLKINEFNSEEE